MKLRLLVALAAPLATDTVPVVAPEGTVTDKAVAEAVATVAETPLNFTTLLAAVVLKPEP